MVSLCLFQDRFHQAWTTRESSVLISKTGPVGVVAGGILITVPNGLVPLSQGTRRGNRPQRMHGVVNKRLDSSNIITGQFRLVGKSELSKTLLDGSRDRTISGLTMATARALFQIFFLKEKILC